MSRIEICSWSRAFLRCVTFENIVPVRAAKATRVASERTSFKKLSIVYPTSSLLRLFYQGCQRILYNIPRLAMVALGGECYALVTLLSMESRMVADSSHESDGAYADPKNNRANTPQRIASNIHSAIGVIFIHHERGVCCHHDGCKNSSHIKRLSHSNFHFH
uniref:Uncharacterized protein n=1 Tax=Siphoviridae sp. ctQ091 TaxID=2825490 RepID=A0A8S5NUM3_9CAUD|nr:MAG TPA: hypothetical protein [Siphoviridae sp. ctQ091]